MSTQRPEDISEAVVVPGAAAAEPSQDAEALSADDTASIDKESTADETAAPEELEQAAKSAEAEVVTKVKENSTPAPSVDLGKRFSKNTPS
ncbi:MAG: hypothetical protein WA949_18425 [Phormidesmis sp.]